MSTELDWEYASKVQKEALDQIDFLPYIEKYKGKKVWDLILEVENKYDNTELTNNEVLEGCTFNWFDESEIVDYLEKRYPDKFKTREVTYSVLR